MTNEVALKILEMEKDKLMLEPEAIRDWELITALDVAIESVEEVDKHGYCILTMFGDCSYQETGCSDCEIKEKIRKALKNERPHGKWEPHRKDLRVWFVCSNCGAYNGGFETDFCPICGADMREADNER